MTVSDYSDRECKHGNYLGTEYNCRECRDEMESLRPDKGRRALDAAKHLSEYLDANDSQAPRNWPSLRDYLEDFINSCESLPDKGNDSD